MKNIQFAQKTAIEFAEYLNTTPAEKQNWNKLDSNDDIPTEDYAAIVRECGECTAEMERAYRRAFNESIEISDADE